MQSKTDFEQISLAEVRKIVKKQEHLRKQEAAQAQIYRHPAEKDLFLKSGTTKGRVPMIPRFDLLW
jgi:hypothetical protein